MSSKGVLRLLALLAAFAMVIPAAWAAEPKVGGELVVALSTDADWLDTNMTVHTTSQMLLTHVAENLVRLEEGEFVPHLAEGWRFSDDGSSLTLYIREGITFHDETPLNAEVVKLNLERMVWSTYSHFLYPELQEIELVDEFALTLHFIEPYAPILPHLAHPNTAILSGEQIAAHFEEGQHIHEPIGTGPFVFQEWERGEHLRFVSNPDYWGEAAHLDAVKWIIIPDDATRTVLLETGEADVIMAVPPLDALALEPNPDYVVSSIPSIRNVYIGVNAQASPFDDVLVRQAFNYAVDREAIVEEILMEAASVARSTVGPGVFGYSEQEPYPYDPDKARQLLAEAGYPDGFDAAFYHPTGRYLMDAAIAEAVQADLRRVGIDVELVTMEWATYLSILRAEVEDPATDVPYDMFLLGWAPGTVDAHHGTFPLLHSRSWPPAATNSGYYSNRDVDIILEKATVAVDVEQRIALYDEAISLLWEDCPWIFLHAQNFLNAQRADVQGVEYLPREHLNVHRAWLDR